eukprot:9964279-Alexandrium_andersonii.AAC.1
MLLRCLRAWCASPCGRGATTGKQWPASGRRLTPSGPLRGCAVLTGSLRLPGAPRLDAVTGTMGRAASNGGPGVASGTP